MAVKTKITLSITKDVVEEIKRELQGESLSGLVEETLESVSGVLFIKRVASILNVDREIIPPKDVPKHRQKSEARAEEMVRSLRDGRMSSQR